MHEDQLHGNEHGHGRDELRQKVASVLMPGTAARPIGGLGTLRRHSQSGAELMQRGGHSTDAPTNLVSYAYRAHLRLTNYLSGHGVTVSMADFHSADSGSTPDGRTPLFFCPSSVCIPITSLSMVAAGFQCMLLLFAATLWLGFGVRIELSERLLGGLVAVLHPNCHRC